MGQIQGATAVANYMADKDRASAVIEGGKKAANVGMYAVNGNTDQALKKGTKLGADTLEHVFNNADHWNNEITKINNWNEAYDHNGHLKSGKYEAPESTVEEELEINDEEEDYNPNAKWTNHDEDEEIDLDTGYGG